MRGKKLVFYEEAVMRKRILIAGSALAVLFFCFIAASPLAEAKERLKWWERPEVQKDLGLSTEELKEINRLNLQMRREMLRHRSIIKENRLVVNNLLEQETLDEAELDRLGQIQSQAQAAISRIWFDYLLEIRKLLGAERFKDLREIFKEYRNKRKKEKN
jgi:hypothetical protein